MKSWFYEPWGMKTWARVTLVVLGIVLLLVVLFGGGEYISYRVESRNCALKAERLHMPDPHYDLWASTCFVQLPDGRSVDLDSLRFNEQGQVSS